MIDLGTLEGVNNTGEYGYVFAGFGQSGRAIASAGDVDGDGIADLIIENNLVFGGTANLEALDTLGGAADDGVIDLPDIAGVNNTGQHGFAFSAIRSVSSAGDVNGDGFDDILIGGPAGSNFQGSAYLVFGGVSRLQILDTFNSGADDGVIDLSVLEGPIFTDSYGFAFAGIDDFDNAGTSVSSAGDLNGDGFDDLLISAPTAELPGGDDQEGETYVVFGGQSNLAALDTLDGNSFDGIQLSSLLDPGNDGQYGFVLAGIDGSDFAGQSVSAAGDVNGDGLDDLLIGAPQAEQPGGSDREGETYVVFGGDFTGSVTQLGTTGADTLTGTFFSETLIGGTGNDTLISNGGSDVLRAGEGDDRIEISNQSFAKIDGGTGQDTLVLNGTDLDLTGLSNSLITGIETIDIAGPGNNTLTLSLEDVFDLSDTSNNALENSGFAGALSHNSLLIMGSLGDTVNLDAPSVGHPSAVGAWTNAGQATIDSQTYDVFNYVLGGDILASVAIDEDI